MMVATNWPSLYPDLPLNLIKSGIPISGLFDLEPMRHIPLNDDLKLDEKSARLNSPISSDRLTDRPISVVVGAEESDEFRRQSHDFVKEWGGQIGKIEYIEYSRWTPGGNWQRLNYKGDVIDQAPNPYGILPFLPVFDYPPVGSDFWLPGGDDLISQQECINIKLVDLPHLLHFHSFGVGFIREQANNQGGETMTVGPGSLVELQGENSEIGFVSQKAEIRAVVEAIDKMLKWFCIT